MTNITEISATGHALCDECTQIQVLKDTYEDRKDDHAVAELIRANEMEEAHKRDHRGERNYGDDFLEKAEARPDLVTFLNMDAPTKDQLGIPVQPRRYRDVAKCLENAPGWASKMMGVMMGGIGMLCFVTHCRLGGGPNLSCTSLFLTLLYMVKNGHTLGSRLQVLLDNTCAGTSAHLRRNISPCRATLHTSRAELCCCAFAENKCNEVIFFCSWLVLHDTFNEAGFFCMLKAHTYTGLDQSFNTMMMHLHQYAMYTISSLLNHIWQALRRCWVPRGEKSQGCNICLCLPA